MSESDIINTHAQISGPREEFAIFMEADGENAIGGIESLFDTVTVVNIDINVENSLVISQKFKNAKYDICQAR